MNGDDPRHGSPRGYRVHKEDGETACEPCSIAWYRYNKRTTYLREIGTPLRVPSLGATRRIRALQALGYGLPELAGHLGIATGNLSYKLHQPYVARRTHDAIADLFERLCMARPPEGWVAQRTRNIAKKRGWAPPLAWDDIDDPLNTPAKYPHKRSVRSEDFDEAVVIRLLSGDHSVKSRPVEKAEALRRWVARGGTAREFCRIAGWREGRYVA